MSVLRKTSVKTRSRNTAAPTRYDTPPLPPPRTRYNAYYYYCAFFGRGKEFFSGRFNYVFFFISFLVSRGEKCLLRRPHRNVLFRMSAADYVRRNRSIDRIVNRDVLIAKPTSAGSLTFILLIRQQINGRKVR